MPRKNIWLLALSCLLIPSIHSMEKDEGRPHFAKLVERYFPYREKKSSQSPEQFIIELIEHGAKAIDLEEEWQIYLQQFHTIDTAAQESLLAPVLSSLFLKHVPFYKIPLDPLVQTTNHERAHLFPIKSDGEWVAKYEGRRYQNGVHMRSKIHLTYPQSQNLKFESIALENIYDGYDEPSHVCLSANKRYIALGILSSLKKSRIIFHDLGTKSNCAELSKGAHQEFTLVNDRTSLKQLHISNNGIITLLYEARRIKRKHVEDSYVPWLEQWIEKGLYLRQYSIHTQRKLTKLRLPENYLAYDVDGQTGELRVVLQGHTDFGEKAMFKKTTPLLNSFAIAAQMLGMINRKATSINEIPSDTHHPTEHMEAKSETIGSYLRYPKRCVSVQICPCYGECNHPHETGKIHREYY